MTRYLMEDDAGEFRSFRDLEDLIQHCRDDQFKPPTVISHSAKATLDVTDWFEGILREAAPELFDYDYAYDWRHAV